MKQVSALLIVLFTATMAQARNSYSITGIRDTLPSDTTPKTLTIIRPDSSLENSPAAPSPRKKSALPISTLNNQAKDHFMVQIGYENWLNKTDSIHMKGISRSFAMYFMYDFPFKTNEHLSIGAGLGIFSSNIYFKNTNLDIIGRYGNSLNFGNADTTHFKKYKLMTTYLEVPLELRYVKDPAHPRKSLKAAAGFKFGTMLSATTKAKNQLNSSGQVIANYVEKEKSKRFFNTTRIAATARVGIGAISLFGNYQINQLVKSGYGPDVRPYTIGVTISGL